MTLPAARPNPCGECPWRRDSLPGWLGPWTAEEWAALAHSDQPIACHTSIEVEGSWDTSGIRQCAGSAIMRANLCKSPRDPEVAVGKPNRETIFGWTDEFIEHHNNGMAAFLDRNTRDSS